MPPVRRIEDIVEAIQAYHPNPDLSIIQRAYMYSAKVHAGQLRKSGEPYLIHPLEVSYILTHLRLDEASIATGLLHDTVEDTLATLEDMRQLFGNEIAQLVDGVTKLSQIRFDTDEHKQAENFRKMLVAMAKDIRVILVKLADRLHNMRTLNFVAPAKQRRISQETMDIYAPLANRLGIHWMKSELEDLAFQYLMPVEHSELSRQVTELTQSRADYVQNVVAILQKELSDRGVHCEVHGRPKHLYSIYKKMHERQIEFEQIYDLIAFRVLCDTVGQCYEVLGYVHALWHPIPGRFKDYIAMPKPNQYQSLHTSAFGPQGERMEVQIRTHEMHRIAEEGIAAHWEYKELAKLGEKGKQQFAWLRQLLEWQQDVEDPNEFLDTVKYDLFSDEVFVFTPRGQVIALNRGGTPVDFAFSIHTEVGLHCSGAKVNGRMVPLRTELKNGDMIEILTSPQQKPSKDWLSFVRSGRAKSKIRNFIRIEERARSKEVGKALVEREAKRFNLSIQKLVKDGILENIAHEMHQPNLDAFFVAIGYGRITPQQLLDKLVPGQKPTEEPALGQLFRQAARRSTGGVVVQGIEDVLVRYGKCCSPLPGDPIIGFITRGRGVTVHSATCTRGVDTDPARRIEVTWDPGGTFLRPIDLRVLTSDKPGILALISQTFTDNAVNISQANCKVTDADRAINTFEVMIRDAEQLRKVMADIRGLKGVISVEKV
jgi:GTP diphosphokinase / guanosine-3',5'-bis(diphosphate) 3'-diphosphatase